MARTSQARVEAGQRHTVDEARQGRAHEGTPFEMNNIMMEKKRRYVDSSRPPPKAAAHTASAATVLKCTSIFHPFISHSSGFEVGFVTVCARGSSSMYNNQNPHYHLNLSNSISEVFCV